MGILIIIALAVVLGLALGDAVLIVSMLRAMREELPQPETNSAVAQAAPSLWVSRLAGEGGVERSASGSLPFGARSIRPRCNSSRRNLGWHRSRRLGAA